MTFPPYFRRSFPAALFLLAIPAASLRAQVAPDASSASIDDEIVELSPFEVTANNKGYLASNALSGTRLNTRLEDIASSITVVTKQQLIDTAVADINDLFLYEANTEGVGNYTSITVNRDGGVNDNIQDDPQTANRIRGMSAANIAIGNFVGNSKVPFDTYNIDAVEISRGANSNLFGLGTGSGVVNLVPSTANVHKRAASVSARADDRGSIRGSFDVNQPLIDGKLALRVASVFENKEFERKPSFDKVRRYYGALTFKPTSKTTFRVSAEDYERKAKTPNFVTPRETISDWLAFGQPTWDPVTFRVTYADGTTTGTFAQSADNSLPFGLQSGSPAYTRGVLYIDPDGSVGHWTVGRLGNAATPLTRNQNQRLLLSGTQLGRERALKYPLFFERGVTDKSFYDWSSINYLAPNYTEDENQTFVAELEQILIDSGRHLVAAKLGWFHQDFERYKRSLIVSNDTILYVDVNRNRLDGTPNPYFGRPFVAGTEPLLTRTPEEIDTKSLDLAYQWTPERQAGRNWIGQQRLNFHAEYRETEETNFRYRDLISSQHSWTNLTNRTSMPGIFYQYYLGDNQGFNVDYAPSSRGDMSGTYPFHWYNGVAGTWVNDPASVSEVAITGTNTSQQQIRTLNVTYQGSFFDDRIVPTVGFRRDRQRLRTSAGVAVDPATGWVSYDNLDDFSNSEWLEQSGDTKTLGIVVKATDWLNVFYNQSDTFNPLGIAYDIFGQPLPNPTSKGEDYGIMLKLLDGKLFVRINRYDNTEVNSRRSQIGTIGSRIHRLEGWRQPYNESFYPWAANVVTQRFANQGITPTEEQIFNAAAELMQIDPVTLRRQNETGAVYVPADVTSRGYELEATYNPTANWRLKFNLAQQEAFDSNIGDSVTQYLAERLPVWTSVRDDDGNRWWDYNNGQPLVRYLSDILAPYSFEVANSGKPRPQLRKWRANLLTNYDFSSGPLRNWSIGGAVRWEDKAAIGFFGMPPDENGLIVNLDPARPIYDKARYHFDANIAYRFKFLNDKVRGRVQLNVRDIFESGRLQPIAVNPDGAAYAFRIVDPRQFILSTNFEF
jgi:Outer membrane receptor for ferric coprogen and ferric-rhodotorulic acid